jgi:hypothetical protein
MSNMETQYVAGSSMLWMRELAHRARSRVILGKGNGPDSGVLGRVSYIFFAPDVLEEDSQKGPRLLGRRTKTRKRILRVLPPGTRTFSFGGHERCQLDPNRSRFSPIEGCSLSPNWQKVTKINKKSVSGGHCLQSAFKERRENLAV